MRLLPLITITGQETKKLSWELLEHKIRYYVYDKPIIDDYQYDMLERLYAERCIYYQLEDNISTMVGIDRTRPSFQMALAAVGRKI